MARGRKSKRRDEEDEDYEDEPMESGPAAPVNPLQDAQVVPVVAAPVEVNLPNEDTIKTYLKTMEVKRKLQAELSEINATLKDLKPLLSESVLASGKPIVVSIPDEFKNTYGQDGKIDVKVTNVSQSLSRAALLDIITKCWTLAFEGQDGITAENIDLFSRWFAGFIWSNRKVTQKPELVRTYLVEDEARKARMRDNAAKAYEARKRARIAAGEPADAPDDGDHLLIERDTAPSKSAKAPAALQAAVNKPANKEAVLTTHSQKAMIAAARALCDAINQADDGEEAVEDDAEDA